MKTKIEALNDFLKARIKNFDSNTIIYQFRSSILMKIHDQPILLKGVQYIREFQERHKRRVRDLQNLSTPRTGLPAMVADLLKDELHAREKAFSEPQ